MSIYCVSGTVIRALLILTHSIHKKGTFDYNFSFIVIVFKMRNLSKRR